MTWLMNNLSTIIVCIALVAVVVLIINKMIKDKKKGQILLWLRLQQLCHGR